MSDSPDSSPSHNASSGTTLEQFMTALAETAPALGPTPSHDQRDPIGPDGVVHATISTPLNTTHIVFQRQLDDTYLETVVFDDDDNYELYAVNTREHLPGTFAPRFLQFQLDAYPDDVETSVTVTTFDNFALRDVWGTFEPPDRSSALAQR